MDFNQERPMMFEHLNPNSDDKINIRIDLKSGEELAVAFICKIYFWLGEHWLDLALSENHSTDNFITLPSREIVSLRYLKK